MLLPLPANFRRKRKLPGAAAEAPAALLSLLSAAYDWTEPALFLVFDRAVEISAIDGAVIIVEDAQINFFKYDGGGGAELTGPATVKVLLVPIDDAAGAGVRLSAPATTGIIAVDDGGTWAGAAELALPWPS
jgi:hypothetical protein